jgi:hypothetical protein
VEGLCGLLPGLPSFLCQIITPLTSRQVAPARTEQTAAVRSAGGPEPEVPIRFVELRVGVPDPAAASTYERVLGVRVQAVADESGEFVIPLADTPVRLARGSGIQFVVVPTRSDVSLELLAAELPGVRWAGVFGAT